VRLARPEWVTWDPGGQPLSPAWERRDGGRGVDPVLIVEVQRSAYQGGGEQRWRRYRHAIAHHDATSSGRDTQPLMQHPHAATLDGAGCA
jgi:hypothetical protein